MNEELKEEILALIEEQNFNKLKFILLDLYEQDIADILEEIDDTVVLLKVFNLLPKDVKADVFTYADSITKSNLVNAMSNAELSSIVEEMYIDDAVDMVEEMPANLVEKVLKNSTKETRATINKFLKYKDDSAGSIMNPEFLDLKSGMTVKDAFERIRKIGNEVETINVLYVVTEKKILVGVLTIKQLLLASPETLIDELMETNVISANTFQDQEEIANLFRQYNFLTLPVVDNETRLVGIITVDDIIDVIDEENTQDLQAIAGIVNTDTSLPYLKQNVFRIFLSRLPWLVILLVSATFTSLIINSYENKLSLFGSCLIACIPMLTGTGGNCGNQVSTTIINGISLGEIEFSDLFRCLWKEIKVSLLISLTLGLVCFTKLQLLDNLVFNCNYETMNCVIVSIAISVVVIMSKLLGCVFPLIIKKLKLDPAVVVGPFITTAIDALSLLIYCNIAIAILG